MVCAFHTTTYVDEKKKKKSETLLIAYTNYQITLDRHLDKKKECILFKIIHKKNLPKILKSGIEM